MKQTSGIAKNSAMLMAMNIAKMIFPLLTLPYLTRVLSKDCYGSVVYVKSVITYLQILVDFGFVLSATKDIVRARQDKAAQEKIWAEIEVGKKYHGTVKSLTSYGAFVDIGGVDGLCHISELSWNRIKHPSEVVSVGDTIEVYVKDIDRENHKVSLGYKKAEDNPWEQLKNNYPIGSTFHAPVVSLTKFGAFVRILPGVDGLVHISEISNDRVEKVSDVLKVGDMVDVKLLDVDFDKKRISLSMKALLNNDAE